MGSPTVGATWMSPYVCRNAGVQDVPLAKHEQKQSTALFAAQGLAYPYEKLGIAYAKIFKL